MVVLWTSMICFFYSLPAPCNSAPGTQTAVGREITAADGTPMNLRYWLFLPSDYNEHTGEWPLLFFLHGRGEIGTDLNRVLKWGPPSMLQTPEEHPYLSERFIVVSPQMNDYYSGFSEDTLTALTEHIVKEYEVDSSRIYYSGICLGGRDALELVQDGRHQPAAVALFVPSLDNPLPPGVGCGYGRTPILVYGNKPVEYFFVPFVDSIEACGGNGRFMLVPGTSHECWQPTYETPEFYDQLLGYSAYGTPIPDVSPVTSIFLDSVEVKAATSIPGASIHVSVNGEPSCASAGPSSWGPHVLYDTTTIRAIACHPQTGASTIVERIYHPVEILPAVIPGDTAPGLLFYGYTNADDGVADHIGLVDSITSPASGLARLDLSGFIKIAAAGEYVLTRTGAAPIHLTVDGIMFNDFTTRRIPLALGMHRIKLEVSGQGGAIENVGMLIEGPGIPETALPSSMLFHRSYSDPRRDESVLRLLSPNGGEVLTAGDTVTVRWAGDTNRVSEVVLDVTVDNGLTWYRVTGEGVVTTADDEWGQWRWAVPDTFHQSGLDPFSPTGATECIMRVSDYAETVYDLSDASWFLAPRTDVRKQSVIPSAGTLLSVRANRLIVISAHENGAELAIIDVSGRRVRSWTVGTGVVAFSLSGLAQGWYSAVLSSGSERTVRELVYLNQRP